MGVEFLQPVSELRVADRRGGTKNPLRRTAPPAISPLRRGVLEFRPTPTCSASKPGTSRVFSKKSARLAPRGLS
jgi:hypothetical protein